MADTGSFLDLVKRVGSALQAPSAAQFAAMDSKYRISGSEALVGAADKAIEGSHIYQGAAGVGTELMHQVTSLPSAAKGLGGLAFDGLAKVVTTPAVNAALT